MREWGWARAYNPSFIPSWVEGQEMKITPTAGIVSRLAARPTQIPFEHRAGSQSDPQKKRPPVTPT